MKTFTLKVKTTFHDAKHQVKRPKGTSFFEDDEVRAKKLLGSGFVVLVSVEPKSFNLKKELDEATKAVNELAKPDEGGATDFKPKKKRTRKPKVSVTPSNESQPQQE
jgi:hypothetical protein